ncbi:hypothetical protein V1264_009797 [Littorina saxatilis]|uniref:FAM124 domain-containing protein n=1 Tax=Littorina saxatilis TaxID=31220 RepID=A0AAN9AN05_9CAEN
MLFVGVFAGSTASSTASSRSEVDMFESGSTASSASGSEMDVMALRDPARLTFELSVDPHEVYPLLDLYEALTGWIDPDLRLFHAAERETVSSNTANKCHQQHSGARKGILVNKHNVNNNRHRNLSTFRGGQHFIDEGETVFRNNANDEVRLEEGSPPVSVVLFLYEEETCSGGRVDSVRQCMERAPWKLHHCERASRRNLNLNPKSLDYFFLSEDLPLWSVRQVHYGKEHIRIVVQTKDDTWLDMVQFYKLILGFEPDLLRDDFCLFTVHSQINFDIQFALKREGPTTSTQPSTRQSVRLKFKVAELGRLVPLFPNVCQPISEACWLTTDHDGNQVLLDVTAHCSGGSSTTSSGSDRASSESCASASGSDVSFDSHDSGPSQASTCSYDDRSCAGPRSTLHNFKRTKSHSVLSNLSGSSGGSSKSQRRVTFCFDDVPPASTSPPKCDVESRLLSPAAAASSRLKAALVSSRVSTSPSSSPTPSTSPSNSSSISSVPEMMFPLKFDTCPTAPLSKNNTREEQIGFYV